MLLGGYEHYLTDSSAVILLFVCNKHDLAGFIGAMMVTTGKAYVLWDIAYYGFFVKGVFGFWESVLWLDAEDNETRKKLLPICT